MESKNPIVLFLCTGNSCRSQMAEGFLRAHGSDRFTAVSAGTDPKGQVHPLAVRVMAEAGIDISAHRPKHVHDYLGRVPVQRVIIVCDGANKTCPTVWPGAYERLFWPFDDPADATGTEAEQLAVFRRVRDQIGSAIKDWLAGEDSHANPLVHNRRAEGARP